MASETPATDQYEPMAVAELHALLDAAVDAIVVIDDRGRIQTFNAAAERMFGYAAEDLLGKDVGVLMAQQDASRHGGYVKRYIDDGEARIIGIGREVRGKRADGTEFPVALSVGEAKHVSDRRFVGIMRDLSSQKEAEQRTRALETRLAHMDRFNLMGEMAAGIAHEINQPLSAIATYAQAAKRILQGDTPDVDMIHDICAKIDDQARRAGQVIENLRKFIRKQEIQTQLLDVNHAVRDVVNLIEADARAAGVPVELRMAEGLPGVRADATQLQQVILNLTRNSVDAMRNERDKHLGIVVETAPGDGGGVRVTVTDHGPGVAPQIGENIFHPFVTTKTDGLGVGLAISRTIVQSYGGSLNYSHNPAGGAVFCVELPADRQETAP